MLIRNAVLADGRRRDVRVDGERIGAVGRSLSGHKDGERVRDAAGRRLLPGMIDAHVHLRQPGADHKETWASGTRSAAAGGVTVVVDQPNTDPPTIDRRSLETKRAHAADALVDYGLNAGAVPGWEPETLLDRPVFALGELFLADSTGEMGIETELFAAAITQAAAADLPVTVHAEDAAAFDESVRHRPDAAAWSDYRPAEAEHAAIEQTCALAREQDTRVHIAHASTPGGIDTATSAGLTTEVTPHHLLLSRDDLDRLGTHGQMNPPLRSEARREAVYDRVVDGRVDMIATDHAPHTAAEKDTDIWSAPSGVPGLETALPLLLAEARAGRLSYERVRDLTARAPADVFGLPARGTVSVGNYADLVLVDPATTEPIRGPELHTNCDWTPFEGRAAVVPDLTLARGRIVYDREAASPFGAAEGQNVRDDR